jgi:hypothetical protein
METADDIDGLVNRVVDANMMSAQETELMQAADAGR